MALPAYRPSPMQVAVWNETRTSNPEVRARTLKGSNFGSSKSRFGACCVGFEGWRTEAEVGGAGGAGG